jgi:hypothetical protein
MSHAHLDCPALPRDQADRAEHAAPAPPVNLAARFTLDEDQARAWLARIVACWEMGCDLDDDGSPVPVISPRWDPRVPGEETDVWRLVRAAVEADVIGCPAGMDVDFVAIGTENGSYYHYAVDVTKAVTLQSYGSEIRKLGDPEAAGVEAALSILREAVSRSNHAVELLAALFAQLQQAA